MPLKATLDDVARTAGVHRSTVSLSLRDHPRIPVHTRERVKAVARQLGYRIDPLVSALMQIRRSPRPNREIPLAFVGQAPDPRPLEAGDLDYFPGAVVRAREFGFRLQRFAWDGSDESRRPLSDELFARGIKGVLLDSAAAAVRVRSLGWDRFSLVAIGPLASPALHHVTENHFDLASEALRRCAARGYGRVGFVQAAPAAPAWRMDRALGAYTIQQLRLAPEPPLPPCPGQPATFPVFCRWFLTHAPAALLTDDPARVRDWLQQLGPRVPSDVGLVGVRAGCESNCSGFYTDAAATGALAVDTLLDLMHRHETGIPAIAHEILLGAAWREHGTLPLRPLTATSADPSPSSLLP